MSDASPLATTPAGLWVQIARDAIALQRLRAEWDRLADEARAGTLFLTHQWLFPWWLHFGAPAGRELRVITVRDGAGALVGLLPLFAERARRGGVEVQRLAFLGDGATGCDHLDVLAAPGREADVLDACLRTLEGMEWDLLDLDGAPRDSALVIELARRWPAMRETGGVVRDGRLRFVCPHIPLQKTYEEFLAALGRRENLRRREKWLHRQPGVSIEVARAPDEVPLALERFFTLHQARWAVDGGSDGLPDGRFPSFHRAAAPSLAERGRLRLYTLFAARRPVASVYGALHGRTFFYYQSGYDPLWAGRSVGLVLLARTVEDAFAEGLGDFDFLRGDEAYKTQWARAQRWTVQARLWRGRRGRAARAAERMGAGARQALKAALPGSVRDAVREGRRRLRDPSGASRGDE
jgi:CelD/BcsL family acetyltransferase involved in cellulose biosynthesis